MPPFLSKSLWINYSYKYRYSPYETCNIIRDNVNNDMKDDYGYLPAKHRLTKALKRLLRNYAPESYEHPIITDAINKMDRHLNMDYTYKYMINLYDSIKYRLYTATHMYNLTKTTIDYHNNTLEYNKDLWEYINIIRDIARWELEPALKALMEKESKKIKCPTELQNTLINKVTTIKNTITLLNLNKDEMTQLINELISF